MDMDCKRCDCGEVQSFILENDNIDDNSLGAERLAHVKSCGECRTLLCEMRSMKRIMAGAGVKPEKDGVMLHDSIAERIRKGDTATPLLASRKPRFRIPFVGVAAAAVVAVFLIKGVPFSSFIDGITSADKNGAAEETADQAADAPMFVMMMPNPDSTSDTAAAEIPESESAAVNDETGDSNGYDAQNDNARDKKSVSVEWADAGNGDASEQKSTSEDEVFGTSSADKSDSPKIDSNDTQSYAPRRVFSPPPPTDSDEESAAATDNIRGISKQEADSDSERSAGNAESNEQSVAPDNAIGSEFAVPNDIFMTSGAGVPLTCEGIIEEAKTYFESYECVHTDGRHDITLEMAQSVDFTAFCDWYISITDMETEYTIENFNRAFGAEK